MKYILFTIMGFLLAQCATTKNEAVDLPYYCRDQNKVEMREMPPYYVNTYEFSDTNNVKLTLYKDTVVHSGDTILFSKVVEKINDPQFCAELRGGGSTSYYFSFLLDSNHQITNVHLVRKGGCDEEMTTLVRTILEQTQFIRPTFDAPKIIMRIVARNRTR